MQKNLVLYAWAARESLGWYPGIIRRFPGSNHNFHITPPRLGFTPGRFSLCLGRMASQDQKRRPDQQQRPHKRGNRPIMGRFFMALFCEALGGRTSGFSRAATRMSGTHINAATGILWPLGGNPGGACGVCRRLAGVREMIHPGLWMTENEPKYGLFFRCKISREIGPEPKSRKSRESREPPRKL